MTVDLIILLNTLLYTSREGEEGRVHEIKIMVKFLITRPVAVIMTFLALLLLAW